MYQSLCNYCGLIGCNLTRLPFGNLICDSCMAYECCQYESEPKNFDYATDFILNGGFHNHSTDSMVLRHLIELILYVHLTQ